MQLKNTLIFLKEKLDSQNDYSSKFSEILQNMEIFQTEENDEKNDDNHEKSTKFIK